VAEFLASCDDNRVSSIEAVQSLHVAAWIRCNTRTTQLYYRRREELSLDEVERIRGVTDSRFRYRNDSSEEDR
jgi:hypothetical protein